ncbi:hypothetical protein L873DRAFT_270833 [Choiromyces venosus 120613-1]|uniref:Uncharacterized protein n=1 Tax=Choiromyces venosus 120613-1 TaxID=1336337 RepID=A0A3N4JD13_9PEZI|nr:hypothetical protein L873DRAFT_270833 [Choiromyces venosus 120613-1]
MVKRTGAIMLLTIVQMVLPLINRYKDQDIQSSIIQERDSLPHHVDLAKTSSSHPLNSPLVGAESHCRSLFGTPPTSLYLYRYFAAHLDCL